MQMWARYTPGRPDSAQNLTRRQRLSFPNRNLTQMTVHRHEALTMINDHGVAVEEIVSRRRHNTGPRRDDRFT